MSVPMWAPFALLSVVCAVWPPPAWTRRVDWLSVGIVVFCLSLWGGVGFLIWRVV